MYNGDDCIVSQVALLYLLLQSQCTGPMSVTVDSGCLSHHGKTKILTDKSNARYAEPSPSTANLIGQFSFSFSFDGTSNLNQLIEMVLAAWLHPRKEVVYIGSDIES